MSLLLAVREPGTMAPLQTLLEMRPYLAWAVGAGQRTIAAGSQTVYTGLWATALIRLIECFLVMLGQAHGYDK